MTRPVDLPDGEYLVRGGKPRRLLHLLQVRAWLSAHPLSTEEQARRRPPPPASLVGALHDTVHRNVGRSRPANAVRASKLNTATDRVTVS